jgi:hypothetical protein
MATSVTNTTSYAGEYKKDIISAALLSAPTLDNGLVEVKPNVKDKRIVKRAALGTLIGSSTCAFNADSSITIDERVLEISQLQVNLEVCKADFEDDYFALEMGDSAHMNMPASFTDFLLAETAAQVASELEVLIWQATTAGSANDFNGFLTLFAADADVIDVTPGAGTIVEELQSIVDAIPVEILRKDDLFIYVANDIYQGYIAELGGFGANGVGANGYRGEGSNQSFGGLLFGGIKIVPVDGFVSGEAVAARKSNLWFGTSLMADWQETKVLDMADLDGSRNVRVIMRMGAGVQYGFGGEIVYYHA